jgi:hypothetical protein
VTVQAASYAGLLDLLYNNLPGFGTLHSLSREIRCNDCTRSTVVRRHTDTFAPRLGRSERTNKQPTSSAMVTARIPVRALAARRKGSWLLVDIGHCFQNLAKALFNRNRPELLRAAQYARAKRQPKWSRISIGNRWFPV